MNYGSCVCCTAAVAAWSLSEAGRTIVPESALLCVQHLRRLLDSRDRAAAEAERKASRVFCACGNEIYLKRNPDGSSRILCARCQIPGTPTVPRIDGGELSLRLNPEHYRSSSCDATDCQSRMVYRYPDGTHRCPKHGAAPEEAVHA